MQRKFKKKKKNKTEMAMNLFRKLSVVKKSLILKKLLYFNCESDEAQTKQC